MRRGRLDRLGAAARWVIGLLLLWAAAPKVWDSEAFAWAVARYEMASPRGIALTAVFVPWMEAAAGVSLLAPVPWRRGAWLVAAALFGMFAVAVASAVARGLGIPCGCLGQLGSGPVGIGHAALNAALAAGCLAAALRGDRPRTDA